MNIFSQVFVSAFVTTSLLTLFPFRFWQWEFFFFSFIWISVLSGCVACHFHRIFALRHHLGLAVAITSTTLLCFTSGSGNGYVYSSSISVIFQRGVGFNFQSICLWTEGSFVVSIFAALRHLCLLWWQFVSAHWRITKKQENGNEKEMKMNEYNRETNEKNYGISIIFSSHVDFLFLSSFIRSFSFLFVSIPDILQFQYPSQQCVQQWRRYLLILAFMVFLCSCCFVLPSLFLCCPWTFAFYRLLSFFPRSIIPGTCSQLWCGLLLIFTFNTFPFVC